MKRKIFNGGLNKGCITIKTIDHDIVHCHTSIFTTKFKFGEMMVKFDPQKKKVISFNYNKNIIILLLEKLYTPNNQFINELHLDDIFDIISMMDQYLVFEKDKLNYELANYFEKCITHHNFLDLYQRSKTDKIYGCLTLKIKDYFKNMLLTHEISVLKKSIKIDNNNLLLLLELLLDLLENEKNYSHVAKLKKIMYLLKQM